MPHQALIEQRPWLLVSLIAGIAYYFISDSALADPAQWAVKGTGTACLAVYAWLARPGAADARQIAVVMAFGSLGDVLIELSLQVGALAFLIGHAIAIRLYWRRRRPVLSRSQNLAAWALLLLIPLIAFLLPQDRSAAPGLALYAAGLGMMTAAAWTSTFSRYRVGMGAVMFAVSDLLIFAQMGPLAASAAPGLLIWPLYFLGQVLICIGVANARASADQVSPQRQQ